ncbi:HAD family hydrolase, partial [Clavibacter michiganensis]|uniref:HAD family hydrolase n=1 Tax=Clavibacter michiganensis TaxID=28447 RepID=UPI0029313F4C
MPAPRLVVISPGHDLDAFQDVVERLGLHRVSYSIGSTAWLDIAPVGVNKATAMEGVRELHEVSRTHVIAMGDVGNDIHMLEWACEHGRGSAMSQAPAGRIGAAIAVRGAIAREQAGAA